MSEDMSPYCSAHDEWLIMKLCMYVGQSDVGYHDANNVSNFGGVPVTQFYAVLRARRTIAVTRPLVLRLLLRDHAQAAGVWQTDAGIKWSYQPKHSPSWHDILRSVSSSLLYEMYANEHFRLQDFTKISPGVRNVTQIIA